MRKSTARPGEGLPVIHPHAAAIDVGSRFHVVAVPPELCAEPVRTFRAFTADLEQMAGWRESLSITTVAMESTGVYRVPLYEVLCAHGMEVVVANAREARAVPGRKSDVNDAQWLQRLHACGLLRASFHPSARIAELRAYLRPRERTRSTSMSALPLYQLVGTDLTQIHDIGPYLALRLISECGTDLSRWPTAKHFTSWLALSPGCKISGGKVLSSRSRKTTNPIAAHLGLAAVTVGRTDTALGAFYRRLSARIGKAKTVTATARKLAILFYNTMRFGQHHADPGADPYERAYREKVVKQLRRRAAAFGFQLELAPGVS